MTEPTYEPSVRMWKVQAGAATWWFSDYNAAEDFYKLNKDSK